MDSFNEEHTHRWLISNKLLTLIDFTKLTILISLIDPRGRPQSRPVITIFTQIVRPSVPNLQNQATITVDWPSGSLMTPDLCFL